MGEKVEGKRKCDKDDYGSVPGLIALSSVRHQRKGREDYEGET